MRVFLAIEIPQDIKEELVEVQEKLKPQISGVRWEKPEKLHLTLIFLGKVEEERIAELEVALREAQGKLRLEPFKIGLSGVRVFPSEKRPRVVLIDVAEGARQVAELQKRLAERLSEAGFEFARLKKPHVTLGRFKRGANSTLRVENDFKPYGWASLTLRVEQTSIVESKLHPAGAIHTPIARIPL